jgi:putative ABC transport system permease protein
MRAFLAASRVGLIEMLGDLRRFTLLIICLAVGTALIAGVSTVGAAITRAVNENAAILMGGDLELTRADRSADVGEIELLSGYGRIASVIDTNVRAESATGEAFVDLVAAGPEYPLLGTVGSPDLEPGQRPAELTSFADGLFGALVDPVMLDDLGLAVGDSISIGGTEFAVRGLLTALPDGPVRGFRLGLPVLIGTDGFAAVSDRTSPLPGLGTYFRYKLQLDPAGDAEAVRDTLLETLPSGWEIRSALDGLGPMLRYYRLFMSFLVVVGLASLLIGGVAVWSAMSAYVAERAGVIAVLRSLGANRWRVFIHFFVQVLALAAVGVGIGLLIGASVGLVTLPIVGQAVGVPLDPRLDLQALLVAAGVGLVTAFAFSYLPLVQAQAISPASLFRARGLGAPPINWLGLVRSGEVLPLILAAAAFLWLAQILTGDWLLVLAFAGASIAAVLVLRIVIGLFLLALKAIPAPRFAPLRQAIRAIAGAPGNSAAIIVSIGLALATLVVVLVLGTNLRNEFLGASVFDAPTLVASDLFPDEVDSLAAMTDDPATGIARFAATPMLRGTMTALNDTAAEQLTGRGPEASFLLSGEIPLTYRAEMPATSRLVEGDWWSADYAGPPLISLHQNLRQGLGVAIGDRMSFSLFGEIVEAEIANFRDYSWQGGIDFLVAFSPGALDAYPSTLLAAVTAAPGRELDVERLVAAEFPDVRFIAIGATLEQITQALGQLSFAAGAVGALAVSNGLLVLIGSLATGRRQREADAVITKVLGARRSTVAGAALVQFSILALIATLVAVPVGIGLAFSLASVLLDVAFTMDGTVLVLVSLGAIAITAILGSTMLWRVLSLRPARLLREMASI